MPKRKAETPDPRGSGIVEEQIVNVKQTLNQFCKEEELKVAIDAEVLKMSQWCYEAIKHFTLDITAQCLEGKYPTEPINFARYYYSFQNNNPKPKTTPKMKMAGISADPWGYLMTSQYYELRRRYNITETFAPSNNIMEASITTYKTVFMNNIQVHTGNRLKKYFLHRSKDFDVKEEITWTDIYDTISFLFYEKSEKEPNLYLIAAMMEDFGKIYTFYDIKSKTDYIKSFEFLFKLQQYNDMNELKNFKLIPQFKVKRHHIQIDTKSLYYILKKNKLINCPNEHIFRDHKDLRWRELFNINKVETKTRKFRYSIKTDGVSVSISIAKPQIIKTNPEPKAKKSKINNDSISSDAKLKEIRSNADKYDKFIGLDPGLRLMVGGISKTREQLETNKGELIKLKSTKFHHEAGFPRRRHKLYKLTNEVQTKTYSTLSPMCASKMYLYVDHSIQHFKERFYCYTDRAVARLYFDKYISTKNAANKYAKEIIGDAKKPFIAIGSTQIEADSPIKKYVRTPHSKLLAALKRRADVLEINEFMTTQACSNCKIKIKTSTHRHRYQFCQKCGKCFNRDVNAGINILQLAWYHHVLQQKIDPIFNTN